MSAPVAPLVGEPGPWGVSGEEERIVARRSKNSKMRGRRGAEGCGRRPRQEVEDGAGGGFAGPGVPVGHITQPRHLVVGCSCANDSVQAVRSLGLRL